MNKSIFNQIEIPKPVFKKLKNDKKYISLSEIKIIHRKKYIVTYLWQKDTKELMLINILNNIEYITKIMATGKTTSRDRLSKIIGKNRSCDYMYYDVTCKNTEIEVYVKILDEKVFNKIVYYDNYNLFCIIEKYIEKLNERTNFRLDENRRKIENSLFEKFKEPKFPKGFIDYCKDWIAKNDRFFISKTRRNGYYNGYCSHCGHTFSISNYKYQGQSVTCAYCGEQLRFYFNHTYDTKIKFVANVGYFEKLNGYPAVRLFHIYRRKKSENYNDISNVDFKEYARYIITDKKVHYWQCEYRYGMGSKWDECEWFSKTFCIFDNYFTLFNNLPSLKINTPLLNFQSIIKRNKHCDCAVFKIPSLIKKYPSLEYLHKQGWLNIVDDILSKCQDKMLNLRGRTVSEVFGIDVNKVLKYGKSIDILKLYIIKKADEQKLTINSDTLRYLSVYASMSDIDELFEHVKPIKFVNYIKNTGISIRLYLEYLNQLKDLRLGMHSELMLYPKNFAEVHARLGAELGALANELKLEKFKQAAYQYMKYELSNSNFVITPISSVEELIYEGKFLEHCVGGYVDRVCNGNCCIFKIRRKEDISVPYVTLELSNDLKVIQVHGYKNDSQQPLSVEVLAFVEKFKKNIIKINKLENVAENVA